MAGTIFKTVEMQLTCCSTCGISYAMPDWLFKCRYHDGGTIYCPNGHGATWTESTQQRLEKKLAAEQAAHDQTKAALRTKMADVETRDRWLKLAEEDQAKLRKRLKHGVCPCCKRTFKQLAAHMANKHPSYGK